MSPAHGPPAAQAPGALPRSSAGSPTASGRHRSPSWPPSLPSSTGSQRHCHADGMRAPLIADTAGPGTALRHLPRLARYDHMFMGLVPPYRQVLRRSRCVLLGRRVEPHTSRRALLVSRLIGLTAGAASSSARVGGVRHTPPNNHHKPPSCRRTWLGSTPKGSPHDPLGGAGQGGLPYYLQHPGHDGRREFLGIRTHDLMQTARPC